MVLVKRASASLRCALIELFGHIAIPKLSIKLFYFATCDGYLFDA